MYDDLSTVKTERRDGVLWASLHRPEHLNAFDARLHKDVTLFLERVSTDLDTEVLVLNGAGKAFSAGGDLRWFQNMTEPELTALFSEARRIVHALLAIEQPVVASTRGAVIGLGATIALMCDFVVAAQDSVFADPHVHIGVVAGDGGAAVWPLLCGLGRAKRYLMLGDQIEAVEAERLGLVDWVVPADHLERQTEDVATRLRNGPLPAIRGTKKALNKHLERAVADTLDLSLAVEKECFRSDDHHEAIGAFLDKRRPDFRRG